MTGIVLSGVLSSNSMFEEFKYYRNTSTQAIAQRTAAGRQTSITQDYAITTSPAIPSQDAANGDNFPLTPPNVS